MNTLYIMRYLCCRARVVVVWTFLLNSLMRISGKLEMDFLFESLWLRVVYGNGITNYLSLQKQREEKKEGSTKEANIWRNISTTQFTSLMLFYD